MHTKDTWLLPQGIEDVLPAEAKQLENIRRKLLDTFNNWGYELVIPPFVDFLDSLLTGTGRDLDLRTFKITDQVSGKLLGIRSDMTPQVARIDAHNLKYSRPTRLCYVGTILKTLGDSLEASRSPMQIGAEIYGHTGLESDIEVIQLMLEMLSMTGLQNVHLDIGHVGIFRGLSKQAGLSSAQESELFDVLQRKAKPELNEILNGYGIDEDLKEIFSCLPSLNGDHTILSRAADLFRNADDSVKQSLEVLTKINDSISKLFPNLPLSFDLAELRGYHYHTGIVFAAFIPGMGKEVARGGRYDNIGEFFGRARAATGFSADLKLLSAHTERFDEQAEQIVYAPFLDDNELREKVRDLRAQGIKVIQQLPGHPEEITEQACTDILKKEQNKWVITPVE